MFFGLKASGVPSLSAFLHAAGSSALTRRPSQPSYEMMM